MNDAVKDIPTDTSDDDLKAMGLPPRFTFDDLKETFEDEEIAKMADDGLVDLPDDFKRPAQKESAADSIAKASDPEGDAGDDDPGHDDDNQSNKGDAAKNDDEGQEADSNGAKAAEGDEEGAEASAATPPEPDPTLDLKNSADAQKVIDSFDDELAALHDQYDDGELTSQELRDKTKALNAAHVKAQREVDDVDRHNADQTKAYQNAWYSKTAAFLEKNPALAAKDQIPALDGASAIYVFDQALRQVTGREEFAGLTMDEKIAAAADMADAYVQQQTGKALRTQPEPAPKQEEKAKVDDQAKKKGEPKKGDRPEPPQTLGNITAATDNEVEDGRFAAIDRADGMEAEEMLSKMSDAERDAYLRGL